jgi:hypothetical protein
MQQKKNKENMKGPKGSGTKYRKGRWKEISMNTMIASQPVMTTLVFSKFTDVQKLSVYELP